MKRLLGATSWRDALKILLSVDVYLESRGTVCWINHWLFINFRYFESKVQFLTFAAAQVVTILCKSSTSIQHVSFSALLFHREIQEHILENSPIDLVCYAACDRARMCASNPHRNKATNLLQFRKPLEQPATKETRGRRAQRK